MSRKHSGKELADIIRKAQEKPGIADLMALMEQNRELVALEREYREAAVIMTVVPATNTANRPTNDG